MPATTTANSNQGDTTSSEVHSRSRRSRFSQPISAETDELSGTAFNPNLDLTDNSAAKAFSNERKCLITFQNLLIGIPQEMCRLSKSYAITDVLNKQCWAGNAMREE